MTKYITILLLLNFVNYSLSQTDCDNCPKVDTICKYNDKTYSPKDEEAPPCWIYFKGIWACGNKTEGDQCDPKFKYVDITECDYEHEPEPEPEPEPVSVKRCPRIEAICKTDDGEVSPNDDDAPPCWIFYKGMWGCGPKNGEGKCENDRYMDITDCEYEPEPEPTPLIPSRCPKVEAICKKEDRDFSPNDDDAPPCWIFYKGMWGCGDKVDGKCENDKYMDITECEYY